MPSLETQPKVKKVAILQSSYIPWKGYFDLIKSVDTFVLFDDVQYTRRDWRNRNRIKTKDGLQWLTIPVQSKGKYTQLIKETMLEGNTWAEQHYQTISHQLRKAPHFHAYEVEIAALYEKSAKLERLSEVNHLFLSEICRMLEIKTELLWSSQFNLADEKSQRLLSICEQLDADVYVSGPAAKDYLDCQMFQERNVEVEWFDYAGYPEYDQLYPPFTHQVSILDLLFNTGADAKTYLTKTVLGVCQP